MIFDKLAAKTAGSSGADLANMANEAAIIAARRNKKKISNDELTEAFERVAIGPERKTKIMNDHEKELTAYHEAGHAIVGHVLLILTRSTRLRLFHVAVPVE